MDVQRAILAYFGRLEADRHHRYRSWEHSYGYFQRKGRTGICADLNEAAMYLGFYLASWGMYRGKSFLLQRDYTVHRGAVECLADPQWTELWEREFGAMEDDATLIADIVEMRRCIGATYSKFGEPTDVLVTKIMLGTLACFPACDRYFVRGFTEQGHPFSYFNSAFVRRVLAWTRTHLRELRTAQATVEQSIGTRYPLMKLVDMYFFQTGLESEAAAKGEPNMDVSE